MSSRKRKQDAEEELQALPSDGSDEEEEATEDFPPLLSHRQISQLEFAEWQRQRAIADAKWDAENGYRYEDSDASEVGEDDAESDVEDEEEEEEEDGEGEAEAPPPAKKQKTTPSKAAAKEPAPADDEEEPEEDDEDEAEADDDAEEPEDADGNEDTAKASGPAASAKEAKGGKVPKEKSLDEVEAED
ncbi:MAG: hypothetical protein OHK93_003415 [Ramalina farinacea]|uniref:Uncharacterized protein n=1 Tax=Ramalina farinacea TaxID=258253 RepID=A0AA43QWH1_9LECA|nr:hypothetical protein [Ramalina farinacea]